MVRWAFLFVFCCTSSILTLDIDNAVFAQETGISYILADLSYEVYPDFSRVILASNKRIDVVSYEIHDPYRIVIDLVGVAFCELENYTVYDKGNVSSIDIIRDPTIQKPLGLDDFFYAVDYIIITPTSKMPYKVSLSEGDKVVVVDIGEKKPKEPAPVEVKPLPEEKPIEEKRSADAIAKGEDNKPALADAKEEPSQDKPKEIKKKPQRPRYVKEEVIEPDNIIDYVHCEALDDTSMVVVSSSRDIRFKAYRKYQPHHGVMLKPKEKVYTNLEEEVKIDNGYISFIRIAEDKTVEKPSSLGESYYPVKYILVGVKGKLPYDFYCNEDGTVSILEVFYPKAKEPVRIADAKPKEAGEEVFEPDEELVTRSQLLKELKEEIKREGLLKGEGIVGLTKEGYDKRRREVEGLTERIGKEVLKDVIVKGKGILNLKEAQDIALKSSPEARTAREEARLAKLKKKEAFRALFPQVKVRGSKTEGDVLGVDFIEEVYGVQAEQSLYQGGRLWNTYRQSKVNLKVAQSRHQKIENDINYKVAETYYDTVTTGMNLRLQEELLKRAGGILESAEKRHKAGLSTRLEILNVRSAYDQIKFQIAVAERDLALARFKLQQAMNMDIEEESIDLADVEPELGFKVIEVDLKKCLDMASENQPDILLNSLLVESNEYNEKIAKAKKRFKVDITGFYGKSGSHYETEARDLSKDWNIGLRVSKPFWGHGASYSYTKEETSRKVGQTDRTGTVVNAGELSLFDKEVIGINAEIKEARVNRQKVENNLIEARRQAAMEVKEAYYSYQQSVIQVKNSLEKTQFQEEAVKVAKAQSELNEALQSQLLESITKLTDEKSVYVKALSDYNLSLSKLNRAVGIRDYFTVE
ncbi:MAG: TolC family protein [Candidatus Omnitrophota bacterium]